MRELFLTSFSGIQYGIWKDEILSVRDIHALHRIPLSPARVAGIMIDDGRTVTLADLPVSIGYEPARGIEQGCILLMEEGDKVTGFVVSGELRTLSIFPQLIFPLPYSLKTPVFDSCAVHDDIPIPLINMAELYARVMKPDEGHSVDLLRIHCARPRDISGMSRLRFISVGRELFAVPAAGIEDRAIKPGPVTPLPNTPLHIKGVTFWKGRLLTVIDLSQRIKRQSVGPESLMLITEIEGGAFSFLIDSDDGTSPVDKVTIKPAPSIVQTSWLKHVVVRAGELIPLIDLAMVLSHGSSAADEKPIWQRYAPDSSFPDIFFKHEVDVVEFSLLGERYALPKQEVEDFMAFKPCRAVPDAPPIVIGVAEHNGEILPVVDLAMMFGRRSLITPEWRMMLVKNGDFRALVITETVFGERQLALEIHRAVPIHLPHNLMYGCYPDDKEVRIILNVEAISVHFEKTLISKFMPALSHQMRLSPTGVVYTFPEERSGEAPHHSAAATPAETLAPVRAVAEPVSEAAGMSEQSTGQEFMAAENIDMATATSQAVPEFKQQATIEDAEFVEWEEEETAAPEIPTEPELIDVVHAAISENTIIPETMTAEAELQGHGAPVDDFSDREPSGEGSKAREAEAMSKQSPIEALKTSARKKQAQNVSETATVDSLTAEPIHNTASTKPVTPYRMSGEVEQLATLSGREVRTASPWNRRIAFGVIAAVLAAFFFYFSRAFDKPAVENSMQGTESAKMEHALVQPEQVKAESMPPRPVETSRAPLELDIPANRSVDIDVYIVREGDTLWSISERFTGNPYNYPRIAGENRIADPDLIFPEQRIRLIKESSARPVQQTLP
ncbi:MAG: chemotaxis protein CheW [Gallionella sp.]